jgi:hypothetical protein
MTNIPEEVQVWLVCLKVSSPDHPVSNLVKKAPNLARPRTDKGAATLDSMPMPLHEGGRSGNL